ncbi:hypothetical protein [Nocardioides sp. AX2bis]|uniref:hypothetical protein n=1 Tax=Nocardioides sp. AX2bis TaxID=2653157 RepID=UPI0012F10FD1|nr:hypothetical protein [Nocardioides sp. AX2bis]VXC40155.1 exported hypothetical protein [Nocardioides sp. AX2bis]
MSSPARPPVARPATAVLLAFALVGLGACSGADDPSGAGPAGSPTPSGTPPDTGPAAEDLAVRDATRQGRVATAMTEQTGSVDRTLDEVLAESERRGVTLATGSALVLYSYAEPEDVTQSSFSLCVENAGGPGAGVAYAVYDSVRAEVVERGEAGGCTPGP